jgi:hypothetical protein
MTWDPIWGWLRIPVDPFEPFNEIHSPIRWFG